MPIEFSPETTVIIDYGMGNLRSVSNKFHRMNIPSIVTSDGNIIQQASKLILPGVGHFASGMKNLARLGIIDILNKRVLVDKIPILGICLGVQLFSNFSEEGNVSGLGWIDAQTIRFRFNANEHPYKIPHMGWNSINKRKESRLLEYIRQDEMFYFVHSFHLDCNQKQDILTKTEYSYEFVSAIEHENIYGTQFHPEKSHEWGFQLLKNFSKI